MLATRLNRDRSGDVMLHFSIRVERFHLRSYASILDLKGRSIEFPQFFLPP